LHRIVTGDEKWIHYDKEEEIMEGSSGHASTSTAKSNIHEKKTHIVYLVESALVLYIMSCSNERDHHWSSLPNTIDEIEPSKEKCAHYYSRHDKIILLHDNARPHVAAPVKTYLETLKWEVLPHPPYSPDITFSDYHLFRSMTHGLSEQHFISYEYTKNCMIEKLMIG